MSESEAFNIVGNRIWIVFLYVLPCVLLVSAGICIVGEKVEAAVGCLILGIAGYVVAVNT